MLIASHYTRENEKQYNDVFSQRVFNKTEDLFFNSVTGRV